MNPRIKACRCCCTSPQVTFEREALNSLADTISSQPQPVLRWGQNRLLLDEPTNHLDIEAIDSLADAIKRFNGGLVLVSHDFRLIDQVAQEIWICEKGTVVTWKGSIREYKKMLAKRMGM